MSVSYQAVQWNRQKKIYDRLLVAGVVLYLGLFVGVGFLRHPDATAESLLIRGFGTAALLILLNKLRYKVRLDSEQKTASHTHAVRRQPPDPVPETLTGAQDA